MKKFCPLLAFAAALCFLRTAQSAAFAQSTPGPKSELWQNINLRLQKDPKNGDLWLEKAEAESRGFEEGDALADFKRALELEPNSALAWLRLGEHYRRSIRFKEAEPCFLKAYKLSGELNVKTVPGSVAANSASKLAEVWFKAKRFDEARALLLKGFKQSGDPNMMTQLADYDIQLKRYSDAISEADTGLKSLPMNAFGHQLKGRSLMKQGKLEASLAEYTKALECSRVSKTKTSVQWGIRDERAEVYTKLGKPELARADREAKRADRNDIYELVPFREHDEIK